MFDTNEIYKSTRVGPAGEPTESDRHLIPDDLESIPPGLILAAYLFRIDRSRLNGHDLVRVMTTDARLAAHFQARMFEGMAELAYCPPGDPQAEVVRDSVEVEFASTEIGAALHLTRQAADGQLGFALRLRERLPSVWEILHCGDIDVRRARIIVDGTDHLTEGTARQVADAILDAAPKLTTGQLAARIRRLSVETDPEEAQTRYETAVEDRRVVIEPTSDGTANLYAINLPADRAAVIKHRLHSGALDLKTAGETRTMDQLRTDVFLDLLESNHSDPINTGGGVVDVQIPLPTLVGVDNLAVEIPGLGPVLAQVGRNIAAQSDREWRYTITGTDGAILDVGLMPRRPTAALKRLVQAQHRTCIFPGCRMPSGDCDLDHTVAVKNGGPTTENNLAP
ncbi:MAG: DUF222 domain-containing protein, partial [Acidimicrobiia bacterium]